MSFLETQLKREYQPGDAIFKDGDSGEVMFILLEGEVEITKVIGDTKMVLATIGKGSIFGEMAIINRRPRSATATAIAPSVALAISRELFQSRLSEVPKWMQAFFAIMSERLREATEKQSVQTTLDVANQFVNILALIAKQVEPDNMDRLVVPWNSTVSSIAFMVGTAESTANEMANSMVTAKLIKSDKREKIGRVMIIDLPDNLYQFADFCRDTHLLGKKSIDEMSEPFRFSKPHVDKVLAAVDNVMEKQGSLDDFTAEALTKTLKEKYKKPLAYFQEAIDVMIKDGVISSFNPDGNEESYRVNDRDLFSANIKKLKYVQKFRDLQEKLAG